MSVTMRRLSETGYQPEGLRTPRYGADRWCRAKGSGRPQVVRGVTSLTSAVNRDARSVATSRRRSVGQLGLTGMDIIGLARVVQAPADDALGALRALRQMRIELERSEAALVHRARTAGANGVQIGEALGVTKQAVHKKHGGRRFDGAS
jgi:hypothetical protein